MFGRRRISLVQFQRRALNFFVPYERERHSESEKAVRDEFVMLDTGLGSDRTKLIPGEEVHVVTGRPAFAERRRDTIEALF